MHPTEDLINGYVDGTLGPAERAEIERHLESCDDCRQLAADLADIRRLAGTLDLREPPTRAWMRLERAIHLASQPEIGTETVGPAAGRRWSATAVLATAAVLIVASVLGLRYALTARRAEAPSVAASATTSSGDGAASAQAVEAELRAAESHYDRAIKGLEQIASSEQGALDPKTAATLQKNLAVIDQAIGESRAAVRAQPTSEPAVNSLMENFKTKLALLQDTVALINEMRKGNEAGTAKIVSGLKQKGD